MKRTATTDFERRLAREGLVIGMDEVGRGSLAGPVGVGACVSPGTEPNCVLADSKDMSAKAREETVREAAKWAWPCTVGMASAAEVDARGITGALRLAGLRALKTLALEGAVADVVLLDGSYDWLTPKPDLFGAGVSDVGLGSLGAGTLGAGSLGAGTSGGPDLFGAGTSDEDAFIQVGSPRVVTRVKADATCSVVAAASIVAKVVRDHLMQTLPDPGYGWASNKGYASAAHRQALATLGVSAYHRQTWKLV